MRALLLATLTMIAILGCNSPRDSGKPPCPWLNELEEVSLGATRNQVLALGAYVRSDPDPANLARMEVPDSQFDDVTIALSRGVVTGITGSRDYTDNDVATMPVHVGKVLEELARAAGLPSRSGTARKRAFGSEIELAVRVWERPCGVVIVTWNNDFGRSALEHQAVSIRVIRLTVSLWQPSQAVDLLRVMGPEWDAEPTVGVHTNEDG